MRAEQYLEEIYERRRRGLELLVKDFGSQVALADKLDRAPNYISRMLTMGKNRKKIGEELAREIEEKTNKPFGWLDQPEKGKQNAIHQEMWPFRLFDRKTWDRLAAQEKRDAEEHFATIVIGIEGKRRPAYGKDKSA